eukprot:2339903-Prymnesium_polylepis.1
MCAPGVSAELCSRQNGRPRASSRSRSATRRAGCRTGTGIRGFRAAHAYSRCTHTRALSLPPS